MSSANYSKYNNQRSNLATVVNSVVQDGAHSREARGMGPLVFNEVGWRFLAGKIAVIHRHADFEPNPKAADQWWEQI